MEQHPASEFDPADAEFIKGRIEYDARTAIRDLVRMHGATRAEFLASLYLEDAKKDARREQH